MGGDNLYQFAENVLGWIDPLGLAPEGKIGGHGSISGGGNQAHEFVRHKAIQQVKGNNLLMRLSNNPAIAVSQYRHTGKAES